MELEKSRGLPTRRPVQVSGRSGPQLGSARSVRPLMPRHRVVPIAVVFAPWVLMLVNYHLGLLLYPTLSLGFWLYVAITGAFVFTGYWIGFGRPAVYRDVISEGIYKCIVVFGAIGEIGVLYDYTRAGFSLTQTIYDPMANRALQADMPTTVLTTISFPFAVCSWTGFIISLLRLQRKRADIWTWLSVVAIGGRILSDVLQSGRGGFVRLALLMISYWTISVCKRRTGFWDDVRKMRLGTIVLVSCVALVAVNYSFFIAAQRHEGATNMNFDVLNSVLHVDPSSRMVKGLAAVGGERTVIGVATGVQYYSHQLAGLDVIVNGHVPASGFGRSMSSWPLQQLARIGLDIRADFDNVLEVLNASVENRSGWITGLAWLINDFGNVGSVLAAGLLAVLLGLVVGRAVVGESEVYQVAAIWGVEHAIWMAQSFPTDGFHAVNTVLLLGLLAVRSARTSHR